MMTRHPPISPQQYRRVIWLSSSSLLLALWLAVSQAQVRTTLTPDGTLGTTVTPNGNLYTITGGTRPRNGSNLFHSFDRFNVGTNDTARFTGPTGITNILSRVTGGQQSMIDGRLQSTIPGANLYLLNPRGVLFGPNASLDVSGSFHVSTADSIQLQDGGVFPADPAAPSLLTVAPPVAFGFLQENPAAIRIQGSTLHVSEGKTLSVVGGDIEIVGDAARTAAAIPTLGAASGTIHLVSVAAPGEVGITPAAQPPTLAVDTRGRLGEMTLSQARIDARGAGGGTVAVQGGHVRVDQSFIVADTRGDVPGARLGIDMNVAGTVTITNGSVLTTDVWGAGNAGEMRLRAGSLEMNNATIASRPLQFSTGDGGNVVVEVGRLTFTRGAQINTTTVSSGRGGSVTVTATDTVSLAGTTPDGALPSGIVANSGLRPTGAPPTGAAGSIMVTAPRVLLTAGAQISSDTFGLGPGGSVTVMATDTVSLAGTSPNRGLLSAISARAEGTAVGAGAGGSIAVTAPRVLLTDDARIINSTFGPGAAGSIAVTAQRVLLTDGARISSNTFEAGRGGSVTVTATDTVSLAGIASDGDPSAIVANTEMRATGPPSTGAGGSIAVTAPRVLLTDGARISSITTGPGRGGSVTVTATDTVSLTGTTPNGALPSAIVASSGLRPTGTPPTGAAGSIMVTAPRVLLTAGAQISSDTFGLGPGGSVTVMATDTVSLAGTSPNRGLLSAISARAEGTAVGAGAGGSIAVTAPRVLLTDGARISSITTGPGRGGSVTVTATDTVSLTGTTPDGALPSGIVANSGLRPTGTPPTGAAGSIMVTAPRVLLTAGAQISSDTFGLGPGGSVTVMATDTVSLAGTSPNRGLLSAISARAEGTAVGAGAGGSIAVTAPRVLLTDDARIINSTFGPGAAGSIAVTAQRVLLTDGARISSNTFEAGRGGSVTVTATDTVSLAGIASDGDPSAIVANTEMRATGPPSTGAGGSIAVTAPRVLLTDGARISSITTGPGRGGSVTVTATDTVSLTGTTPNGALPSAIVANSGLRPTGTPPTGAAGSIMVTAPRVLLTAGAQISSLTTGPGPGGTVTVNATDTVTIRGPDSGLFTTAADRGPGGDIVLEARTLILEAGARLAAASTGPSNAGNIRLRVTDAMESTDSVVTTEATRADGGEITVQAQHLVRLRGSAVTATVGGGAETVGGNITIDPQFVVLQNSQIVANASKGQGGNIHIRAQQAFLADPASLVDASSELGIDGQVDIQAPVKSISGVVAPLPQAFASAAALLRSPCAARLHEGTVSTLVERGRDGVPTTPDGVLPSRLPLASDTATLTHDGGLPSAALVRPLGESQRDPSGPLSLRGWAASVDALRRLPGDCASR